MTLGEQYDRIVRGYGLRYHVFVTPTKVWNFDRQAFDYPDAGDLGWDFVQGFADEAEARTAIQGWEREHEERARSGDGTAPDLEFGLVDTAQTLDITNR